MHVRSLRLTALVVAAAALQCIPVAQADNDNNTLIPNNRGLNDGVIANVFTVQHQAGCKNDVRPNLQLQLAAQRHAEDVLNNRGLDGDIGSDGSTVQDRAHDAGFNGRVAETIAMNLEPNDLLLFAKAKASECSMSESRRVRVTKKEESRSKVGVLGRSRQADDAVPVQ